MVELEIDGLQVRVPPGTMIIEAAELLDIYIPRYCYHKGLSIAANCRMCLVEVEKVGKPLPACATPVSPDMKVMTRSAKALAAQRDVLKFLLINHPLDCPICDQGGVCELQDFSMGYGTDRSEFTDTKTSTASDDIGPLVETWMTRCIKCTRCVRFGDEVAGMRELGVVSRGDHSTISTYVKTYVDSELSGNITDICPVGALTAKPSRYGARNWELLEHTGVALHDCVGSNIYLHSRGYKIKPSRQVTNVVARENNEINDSWISDRDRFSYCGLAHESRCFQPEVKRHTGWEGISWARALDEVTDRLQAIITNQSADQLAFLAGPNSSTESMYVMQKWARQLGCHNVDHRVTQQDFSLDEWMPENALGMSLPSVASADAVLLFGSHLRFEQPMLNYRVRQAALAGASVDLIHVADMTANFELKDRWIDADMVSAMASLAKALGVNDPQLVDVSVPETIMAMAGRLAQANQPILMLGDYAFTHPQSMTLRALARMIERDTDVQVAYLTPGANTAGAWRAGMVPHRQASGELVERMGLTAQEVLTTRPVRAYVLLNLEPEQDCADSEAALAALADAGLVVCLTPYVTDAMREYADFILPIAPSMQTEGTFINVAGDVQTVPAIGAPDGEAKPDWKVLRALATYSQCEGVEYKTTTAIMDELMAIPREPASFMTVLPTLSSPPSLMRYAPRPLYSADPLVRRSEPLQQTALAGVAAVQLHPDTAAQHGVNAAAAVTVQQGGEARTFPLQLDDTVARDVLVLPAALPATAGFGHGHGPIEIREAS